MIAPRPHDSMNALPESVRSQSSFVERVRYWKTRVGAAAVGMSTALPPRRRNGLSIFNYHRVHPDRGLPLSVTPAALDRHVQGLIAHGYQPCLVQNYLSAALSDEPPTGRWFAVTFDDAFENVATHAYPVLAELDVPATLFLATASLDGESFPFDPLVYRGRHRDLDPLAFRPIRTGSCEKLIDAGWDVGGHTHTHCDFTDRPGLLAEELEQSADVLRTRFGVSSVPFSFPYGNTSRSLRDVVAKSVFSCALTTEPEVVVADDDRYAWGRFGAEEYDTAATQAGKASGWYSAARTGWRRIAYGREAARSMARGHHA